MSLHAEWSLVIVLIWLDSRASAIKYPKNQIRHWVVLASFFVPYMPSWFFCLEYGTYLLFFLFILCYYQDSVYIPSGAGTECIRPSPCSLHSPHSQLLCYRHQGTAIVKKLFEKFGFFIVRFGSGKVMANYAFNTALYCLGVVKASTLLLRRQTWIRNCLVGLFKGTVSWDRFHKCWRKWTDLGLNKGRGWFLNFSETPLTFNWNKTSVSR